MNGDNKKAVLITGANGGIGKSLCAEFSNAGYFVLASDIHKDGESIADAYLSLDLERLATDPKMEVSVESEIVNLLSGNKLRVLINNAAFQKLAGISDLRTEEFHKSLNVNLVAPLVLSRILFSILSQNKGSIINIGSIHSKLTKPEFISYATSKAALLGLTQALAVDMKDKVRVNIIQPAATRTEMLVDGFKEDPEAYAKLQSYHPLQRIAEPKEVSQVALFLASEDSSFISGAAIDVDGGIGHRLHDPV